MNLRNGGRLKPLVCLAMIGVFLQCLPSALASVNEGSKCSKIGAIATTNDFKYQCVVSGSQKVWKKVKFTQQTPAPRQKNDFSSFACNPYDSRLKNLNLPKGDSLEIKAAASCVALSYFENITTNSKIRISLSPDFSQSYYKTLERSVRAADRIFGHFSHSDKQTIEVFGSDSPDWLCKYGRAIYSGRSTVSWEKMPDSGCDGNTQGRSRADVIDSGKTPVLWFLTSPQNRMQVSGGKYETWPESLQQFGHELAHAAMFQLSDFYEKRYVEHPGGWYPEGQAQYLDLGIAWLEFGDNTWRDRLIVAGKRDAAKYFPSSRISFEALSSNDKDYGQAIYSLGGIASEYLIAHYGLKKTFAWYSAWSAPGCQSPNTQSCWAERASITFNLTPEKLYSQIDNYVNKQLGIVYAAAPSVVKPIEDQNCLGEKLPTNNLKRKSIGIATAESARNCIIYHWLNNRVTDFKSISVISDVELSSEVKSRATSEVLIGLSFYKTLLRNPNTKIKIVMATNPNWTCDYLTKELTGSDQESIYKTLKGSGCSGTTIENGHSWDGWQNASCSQLNSKVNLPFFAVVNSESISYIVLSRCKADIQNRNPGYLNITRKLAQSFFAQVGGFGFRRYLFESGWQEIISQYGQSIFFENSADLYPDAASKAALSAKPEIDYLASLNGVLVPLIDLPDAPSSYPNFNLWKVQSNIAAEYLIGTYGVIKSLEILVGWEKSRTPDDRSTVTIQLTGLSEKELFSKIDAYIKERLK